MKEWTRKEIEEQIIGKVKAITVPVNVRVEGEHRILETTELESILRKAKFIGKQACGCRKMMGNCSPAIQSDDGCISIYDTESELLNDSSAKQVTVEEALEGLKRTSRAGLVHMAYIFSGREEPNLICSCCDCCCHTMGAVRKMGYKNQLFPSRLVAVQNQDLCNACGLCAARCRFGARAIFEKKLRYKAEECFGCGVCLETCPTGAISMADR